MKSCLASVILLANITHEEVLALARDVSESVLPVGEEYKDPIAMFTVEPFWNIMTFNSGGKLDIYLTQYQNKMSYADGDLWFYDRHRDIESCAYKYETLAWILDKHTVLSFHTSSETISNDIPLKIIKDICPNHIVERTGNDILIDKVKVSPALACGRDKI